LTSPKPPKNPPRTLSFTRIVEMRDSEIETLREEALSKPPQIREIELDNEATTWETAEEAMTRRKASQTKKERKVGRGITQNNKQVPPSTSRVNKIVRPSVSPHMTLDFIDPKTLSKVLEEANYNLEKHLHHLLRLADSPQENIQLAALRQLTQIITRSNLVFYRMVHDAFSPSPRKDPASGPDIGITLPDLNEEEGAIPTVKPPTTLSGEDPECATKK